MSSKTSLRIDILLDAKRGVATITSLIDLLKQQKIFDPSN